MNYSQLQQAILDDTHKPGYAGEPVQRFIAQAEGLISSRLEAYNLLATLLDVDRVVADTGRYAVPGMVSMRYVKYNGLPLDRVDGTSLYLYKRAIQPVVYTPRTSEIEIASIPPPGASIDIDYMGKPVALAVAPTNSLLDEFPQLYIQAASVYVFLRAEDFDSSDKAMEHVVDLCNELNRKSKKLLGGTQAAPVYNTHFRSAY